MLIGQMLGIYEVLAKIGEGGMGEVYRARDTKLRREVAIKILPEAFAADPDRAARFQREAELLASLNHPNIAAVYGVEESAGVSAIVMELVAGETLAEVIARGALPVDEALSIARQIADALEAAHDRGVIHRDLKPANVKITPDGKVKVLDFGLAKALEGGATLSSARGAAGSLTMSPTLSVHATYAGIILGTAAYMSPEQARGKSVDRRADIWAFGCVLYEMLSGRQAFEGGDTVSDAVAAILRADVDWSALPPAAPPYVVTLLRRCLQKDPQKRLPHIGVARLDLDEPPVPPGRVEPAAAPNRLSPLVVSVAALVAILVAAAAAITVGRSRAAASAAATYVDIATPATNERSSIAIAPDGRKVVFVGAGPSGFQLYLRRLDSQTAVPLPGTEGAQYPFWSPNSRSIAFFSNTKLKRVDIDAGGVQSIANVLTPAGGAWNNDGTIIFTPNSVAGLFRVSAAGGAVTPLVSPDTSNRSIRQRFPQFLPDSRHYLYFVPGGEGGAVVVDDLDRHAPVRVTASDAAAVYGAGYLFFVRQGAIVAQAFDVRTLAVGGPVARIADGVTIGGPFVAAMSVSATGSVLFRTGSGRARRRLLWFDRSGRGRTRRAAAVEPFAVARRPHDRVSGQPPGQHRHLADRRRAKDYDALHVRSAGRRAADLVARRLAPVLQLKPDWRRRVVGAGDEFPKRHAAAFVAAGRSPDRERLVARWPLRPVPSP